MADTAFMEKLVALCKRRGFIYPSSEIYGGINGFWDYGPMGVELKRNIKNQWWRDMVTNPPNGPDGSEIEMVGLDASIIMNPKVWEASGHATGFQDPMSGCLKCRKLFRADQLFVLFYQRQPLGPDEARAELRKLESWSAEHDDLLVKGGDDKAIRELRGLIQGALNRLKPELIKSVIAGGREDAIAQAKLTNREKKEYGAGLYLAANYLEFSKVPDLGNMPVPCPECEATGSLMQPRRFNLMFKTSYGALEDLASQTYLRPETAQGIFANFKNVVDTTRVKIPFGIAQQGKAFRNEINPRNFTFRSREFEQMEIEFFCDEASSMDWYQFWRNTRYNWYVNLGLKSEKLRLRDQTKEELAHYSRACADIEYLFPFSDEHQELEGVAHRGNFDLTQHEKHSGVDLHYFEEEKWAQFLAERKAKGAPELTKEEKSELGGKPPYRYLPTVIEPSAGADRATLAFLCEAYTEDQAPNDKGGMETRVVMKFHPKLAPIKAAVFPLVNKEGMPEVAEKLYRDIKRHMTAFLDTKGAIGRRYRRQDEIGTPFCITIDGETIKSDGSNDAGAVTIRDRDSLQQWRVPLGGVVEWLREKIGN